MTTYPVFKGAKPSVPNKCAYCESSFTAGCWRRGWEHGSHFYANLCNKCGLKYKNGRLNRNFKRKNKKELTNEKIINEIKSEYKSYTMFRQNLLRNGKRVLFYVQDNKGESILAIMGVDLKRTGHFVYKSQPGFEPPLRCTNRNTVISWLANLGAKEMVIQSNHHYNSNEIYDDIYNQECEMDTETSAEFESISFQGENQCTENSLEENQLQFQNKSKCNFNYCHTRRKRKLFSNYELNDIFVNAELKQWALSKPNAIQIDKFKSYHYIFSTVITSDISEHQMTNEDICKLLIEIEKEEDVCMKLIEMTNISESVNKLQSHSNHLISDVARDIIRNWKTKTFKVLDKAKSALYQN